jgi:oxygen-independent coproporphyrinogen-3 oxidase
MKIINVNNKNFFKLNSFTIYLPSFINKSLPINSLGIYIHFPFCQKICFYCDFFKITPLKGNLFFNNFIKEVLDSQNYLNKIGYPYFDKIVNSIYIGGGTPNLVSPSYLEKIFNTIYNNFKISLNAEITIELNPELITPNYLKALKNLGINRVSIGVQSFNLFGLRILGRLSNPSSIISKIELTSKYFSNISIDLIYLYPFQKTKSIIENINIIKNLPINHISYYALDIYNDKKVIYHQFENILKEIENIKNNFDEFYDLIHNNLKELGFEHYEVSNFTKNKKYSIHNLKYWYYFDYIGFGPSAVSKLTINNQKIYRINKKQLNYFGNFNKSSYFEQTIENIEEIDNLTAIKEIIMLALRTKWGLKIKHNNNIYNLKLHPLNFKNLNSYIYKIYDKLNINY